MTTVFPVWGFVEGHTTTLLGPEQASPADHLPQDPKTERPLPASSSERMPLIDEAVRSWDSGKGGVSTWDVSLLTLIANHSFLAENSA